MDGQNLWGPLAAMDWLDSLIAMLQERKSELVRYIYKNGHWHDRQGNQVQLKPDLSHIEHQQSPSLSGFMPASVQQFLTQCAGQPVQRYSDLEKLGMTLDSMNQTHVSKPTQPNVSQMFQENYQRAQHQETILEKSGPNQDFHGGENVPSFLDVVEQAKKDARNKYQMRKSNG